MGFGRHSRIHSRHASSASSEDLPEKVEIVDRPDRIAHHPADPGGDGRWGFDGSSKTFGSSETQAIRPRSELRGAIHRATVGSSDRSRTRRPERLARAGNADLGVAPSHLKCRLFMMGGRGGASIFPLPRPEAGKPNQATQTIPKSNGGRSHARMAKTSDYLALDLGAESGRGLLGKFDGERIALEEVHRFPNGPIRVFDTLHWDLPRLFEDIKVALRKAATANPGLDGVGVDTWGSTSAWSGARGYAAGQPGPLPRCADRRHARGRLPPGPSRADLRDHRAPVPAVQHALSTAGDAARPTRRSWRWPKPS